MKSIRSPCVAREEYEVWAQNKQDQKELSLKKASRHILVGR